MIRRPTRLPALARRLRASSVTFKELRCLFEYISWSRVQGPYRPAGLLSTGRRAYIEEHWRPATPDELHGPRSPPGSCRRNVNKENAQDRRGVLLPPCWVAAAADPFEEEALCPMHHAGTTTCIGALIHLLITSHQHRILLIIICRS